MILYSPRIMFAVLSVVVLLLAWFYGGWNVFLTTLLVPSASWTYVAASLTANLIDAFTTGMMVLGVSGVLLVAFERNWIIALWIALVLAPVYGAFVSSRVGGRIWSGEFFAVMFIVALLAWVCVSIVAYFVFRTRLQRNSIGSILTQSRTPPYLRVLFHRYRFFRWRTTHALSPLALAIAGAGTSYVGIFLVRWGVPERSLLGDLWWEWVFPYRSYIDLIAILILARLFGRVIHRSVRITKTRLLASAAELAGTDKRSPFLYLRSFRDDQLVVPRDGRIASWIWGIDDRFVRLEEIIANEVYDLGPIIALSSPEDRLPPLGAARDNVSGENWRTYVISALHRARHIVCVVGSTENFRWEMEQIIASETFKKLILVLPCRIPAVSYADASPRLSELLGTRTPPAGALLTCWSKKRGQFLTITSARANESSYVAALRLAMNIERI